MLARDANSSCATPERRAARTAVRRLTPTRIHTSMCQKDGLAELLISALAEASNTRHTNHVKNNDVKLHSFLRRWFAFLDRSLIGALMHDATSQFSHFRLAIAPGVPSSCLTTLLPHSERRSRKSPSRS